MGTYVDGLWMDECVFGLINRWLEAWMVGD